MEENEDIRGPVDGRAASPPFQGSIPPQHIVHDGSILFRRFTSHASSRYITAPSEAPSSASYQTVPSRISTGPFSSSSSSRESTVSIESMSEWKRYLWSRGLIPKKSEELDWSGRGQHAEYRMDEGPDIPLVVGDLIGHSATALVHEVQCRGITLARKTITCNARMKRKDAITEVEHLQKLRHSHIIRVVGTYVIGKRLAILLYPAAEWNLETFFDERKSWGRALGFFRCLSNAVAFLYSKAIKHMDIKPQNILVKRDWKSRKPNKYRVYLADFGIARSYTSTEDCETDSPTSFTRIFAAPEVVAQEKRGFSADVFSLGCVLVEVTCCLRDMPGYEQWPEEDVPRLSAIRGFSYQANIDTVTLFLDTARFAGLLFGFTILPGYYKACIRSMISTDPKNRPEAKEVATVMAAVDGKFRNWYECDCEDVPAPFQVDVGDGHLDGDSSDRYSDGEREELDEAARADP